MKKTLLLTFVLLAAMATSTRAQSFEFQYQGLSLAEGDTVTIKAELDIFGEMSCETNPADNPTNGLIMKKLTSASPNVTADLEITDNALTCSQLQWCMGGECKPFDTATKLTKEFKPSDKEQVQFDAYGIDGDGYLIAKLTVKTSMETLTLYIRFFSGEYDGIKLLHSETKASDLAKGKVFTLAGQRVADTKSAIRAKGIYIINGKKVIIK